MGVLRVLESVHFYRHVPRDLSQGTASGGVLSLLAAAAMAYLFFSDLAAFLRVDWNHEVHIDQIYDHSIRVNFNMTMLRLPCQYVNLDVFDVMGASVHNVTRGVFRHRVLANGVRADFKPQKRPKSWQRSMGARADARPPSARELNVTTAQVEGVTHIDAEGFGPFLRARPHALVLFGAAWCPWTSDLLPTWADVERRVRADARLGQQLAVGYLDCARPEVRPVCKAHFVQAFPSVHLYQHNETSVHQNYVGPRAPEPLLEFARAAVEHTARSSLATPFHANGVHGAHGFEGCGLSGAFYVARVPGSLRISAHSDAHSLNPAWIDMDHHVDALTFGVPDTKERLHHEKALQKLLEESEGLSAPALEAHERRGLTDPFEHIDDLAFLPQHSAGSVVRPFRPGKRKASRFERFVSMVERLKHKQAKVASIHAHDAHGPNSLGNRSFVSVGHQFVSMEHYLKVIPTTYKFADNDELDSYTYTVNNRQTIRGYSPTAVFSFDFSPLRVAIVEERTDLATFLTQVCAIIGGVFTVVGLIDASLFHASDLLAKKMQLGKAS